MVSSYWQYNDAGSTPTSSFAFSKEAPAFVIGNGRSSSERSDAFVVDFDGNAKVQGELNVSGPLHVNNTVFINGLQTGGALIENDLEIKGSLYFGDNEITVEANELNSLSGINENVQSQLDQAKHSIWCGDKYNKWKSWFRSSSVSNELGKVSTILLLQMKSAFQNIFKYPRSIEFKAKQHIMVLV